LIQTGASHGPSKRRKGYAMVATSFVIMGSVGALVTWATAPESMLLVLRMGIGAATLAVFFARSALWAEVRRPGILKLLLVMAAIDSGTLLLFFTSMRLTNVAIGMFLLFLSPLWVALLAPPILHQRTDRMVWPGLGLAMAGLALIIVPPAVGTEVSVSFWGILCGLASGILLAGCLMLVSALRRRGLRSATIVIAEGALDVLFLLPLAVWQTWIVGSGLTSRDLLVGLVLGTLCMALTYMLLTEGMGFIPVQHVTILGYLEPLAAPLYAFLLVGEVPSDWTMLGGLLIIAAGVLVVLAGERQATLATQADPAEPNPMRLV